MSLNQTLPGTTLARARSAVLADDGAATAEYVIATMAAVGLAGLLVVILRGDAVKDILLGLVRTALSFAD
jgi:hypothetical protein